MSVSKSAEKAKLSKKKQPESAQTQATAIGRMEVSTTFIYYCAGTTFIAAFLASKLLHLSLLTPQPYRLGLLFGLVGGILGAYFNHTASFSLTTSNPQALAKQLTTLLTDIGYSLAPVTLPETATPANSNAEKMPLESENSHPATPSVEIYRPSFWRSLFTGPIIIQRDPKQLTLISRAKTIKWLRSQLSP